MATAEVEVGRYSKLGRQAAALTTKLPAPTAATRQGCDQL